MSTDVVELGFRVDTTDIDRAVKKLGLLDREFGKVERSGGLVARSFESVGESGKKSGGLVSRAFSEASRELDKTLRSVAKLIPALKVAASELSDFASKYQRMENLSSIDIHVNLDTKRAISGIAELKAIAKSTTISIDARINDRASGALASTTAAVYSLTAAVASGLAPLRAYSHELGQLAQNAKDAARALTGASNAAGRGIAGNVPRQSAPIGGDSALRKHGLAVYDVTQRYSGLAVQLIAVKSAMAVFTAAAAGAIPVLGQMAAAAGAVFGTALATTNVAAMSKELSKLTETTGASAEGLQKWRLAARFEGVKAELKEFGDMTGVFTDLSSQMDKLGTASGKDFADALKAIGLNAKDIKNSDPSDALLKIGDAIAKSNMSTRDKTAFLGAISDDAAKLLPLLEKAGQKFNEISDYASKVGAIQSDAQLAAAKEANTQLSYFKVGLEGVQTQLAAVGNRVINTLGPNIKKLFVDAKAPIDDWALAVDIVLTKFKHDLDSTGSWSTAFARMFEGMYPTLYQFLSSAGKFGKGYGEAFVTPMLDALKRGYVGISEALGNAGGAESLGKGMGEAMLPVITIVDTIVASIKLLINNWDALKAVAAVTPIGLVAANWDSVVAVFELVGNGIRGVGEAFGLLNPATTANASGVQIFVAALGALLVSGAASRLVLGAIGATFSTLSFALAPLGAVLGIVATGLKAVALAAMANPIGALITVIAMGAALIFTNWSKVGEFFTGLWAGVKSSFSGLIDWWNNTTPKEKILDIKANTIDVVKEKYQQFSTWWSTTTLDQKVADIKAGAIDLAKKAAEGFKNWWDGSTLKEWASSIGITNIDEAKEKASQFSTWWKETTLAEKALAIATPHIAVARIAAEGFFSWWDKSTLKEISPPIVLNTVEKARTNLVSFFLWWDGRTLTEKVADIKITALNVARSAAESFKGWWASWTLKEVVADVTYETLVWAWEKGKELSAWWNSWSLPVRNADVEYGMLEYAYDLGKRFANWWNNLTLKSIIPDIKMPELPSVFEWGRNIGKDLADGAAEGLNRATSHITAAEKTANKIPLVMRAALDTHSPSKITEAIGADTAAGLGLGIEKGEKKVKSAAEKTAQAAADAFKSIMEGLNKQLLSFTAGDEAARRYELTQQKIVGSNQDVVIATEAKIKAFEDERKKTEEAKATAESAAKAYADLISGLNGQVIALSQGDEAGRRFELTQQKITGANQDTAISLQNQIEALEAQKTIKEDLARVNAEALSLDAQMTALKAGGVAAMQAEEVRQSALNDLKEKGIGIESSLAQQYLTSKTAVEAKTKALAIEQDIQNNLRDIDWLSKEIEATQKGAAALADLNVEKAISNALSEKNLTLESDQGRRVAETTRQLFAKNKQLEIGQSLYQLRTDNEWLRKEIDATLKGEEALKAFNIQKRISEELDRLGIATGTQAAAQVEDMIRQQEGLKEKLSSIQGLRQPISQFFGDVMSDGKNAFKNLGDYILNWLKKMIVEFATNKLMLSIGLNGTTGGLGGIGDKITGIFDGIGKTITSAVTGLFGSGGLGGILGSVAGALGPIGLIAGAASLFKGLFKKEGNLVFSQGMQQGQQLTGQGGHAGQGHYRQTELGLIGATSSSNKIGRQKDFVPQFHQMMDAMVQLDNMIATTIPASVENIKTALTGLETAGFSMADMMKQRYSTVLSALPEELQRVMLNGRDIVSMTGEEITARFALLTEVANSSLIPSMNQLGWQLGTTEESALAAAMGFVNAAGSIDTLKASLDAYYNAAYTAAEKESATRTQAKSAIDAFNNNLGLTGKNAINNIVDLRKYIDAQDKTTEAGQKATAAALAMVDSLVKYSGTAEDIAKAEADKLAQQQAAFNAVSNAVANMGLNLNTGTVAATNASTALVGLFGSVEAFNQSVGNYYQQFFSDEERKNAALADAALKVQDFNKSLGLTGAAAIDSKDEFRAYVDSLDLTTDAGRKAFKAAMDISTAMADISDTGKGLDGVLSSLPAELLNNAKAMQDLKDAGAQTKDPTEKAASAIERVGQSATNATPAIRDTAAAIESLVSRAGSAVAAAQAAANTVTATRTSATISQFASGGRYSGGLALVGERGPELINFNTGGYVYDAAQTRSILAANENNVIDARPLFRPPPPVTNNQSSENKTEITVEFKPVINVSGGADKSEVAAVVNQALAEFNRQLPALMTSALNKGGTVSRAAGVRRA